MRITRSKLIDLARQETARRASLDDDILAGYVTGSVASGEPLLGGKGDIDLVLIHRSQAPTQREILPLSNDVHLDVTHHLESLYAHPPQLRVHPWLGPEIYEPALVHDPQRFFERVQAGVRGQFQRPDHVVARARAFLDRSRTMSASLHAPDHQLQVFAAAALEAANAAACLAGSPASGRRLALILEQRARALDHPEVFAGFARLLGADRLTGLDHSCMRAAWSAAFEAASRAESDPEMARPRHLYYLAAFQAFAEMGKPELALWPMLTTWDRALATLDPSKLPEAEVWQSVLAALGLTADAFAVRSDELESYADHMESIIEEWAEGNGA